MSLAVTMKSTGLHLLLLCIYFLAPVAGSLPQPHVLCPPFVDEEGTLMCECTAPNNVHNPTITWPYHSDSFILVKENINRRDNGTTFTCLMQKNGENSTATYTLQVAYGPSDDTLDITGPGVFITDGFLTLNLSCQASDVNPPDLTYAWFGLGLACDGGNKGPTCSFRPQPRQHDGRRIKCRASNTAGQDIVTASTEYRLNLTYPPTSLPVISGHTAGQVLKTGDKLTCTVFGGKPFVSEVFFNCTDPALDGAADVVDESGVSSVVTIEAENATGSDTVCTCWAVWEPGQYNVTYSLNATVTVQIKYTATIINFTIDNSSDVQVVNESSHVTVTVLCTAIGQPAPVLTLTTPGNDAQLDVTEISSGYTETVLVIADVTCTDMGNYTCTADNGHRESASARLIVNCPPRLQQHDGDSNLPEMTQDGLTLSLVAHPVPDNISWGPVRESTSNFTIDTADMFAVDCVSSDRLEYLVSCTIQAKNLSTTDAGLYSVSLSNGFGTYIYSFKISGNPGMGQPGSWTDEGLSDIVVGLIVVGSLAALVLLGVGVKVVVVVCSKAPVVDKGDNQAVLNNYTNGGFEESPSQSVSDVEHAVSTVGHAANPAGQAARCQTTGQERPADTTYASPGDISIHRLQSTTAVTHGQQLAAPHAGCQPGGVDDDGDATGDNMPDLSSGSQKQARDCGRDVDYNTLQYHRELQSETHGDELYSHISRQPHNQGMQDDTN